VVNADGAGMFTNRDWGVLDSRNGQQTGQTTLTTGTIEQQYIVVRGEAKLKSSVSTSHAVNLDGSAVDSVNTTVNRYNDLGQLVGADANNHSVTAEKDLNGNVASKSTSDAQQKLVVIVGE